MFDRVYGGDIGVAEATFHVDYDAEKADEKGKAKIEEPIIIDNASVQTGGSSDMVIHVDETMAASDTVVVVPIEQHVDPIVEEKKNMEEKDKEDKEKLYFGDSDDDFDDLDDHDTPQSGAGAISGKSDTKFDSVGGDVPTDEPQPEP